MASYKILQDIEAEDKIIWRLSLKQFIFAFIGCGLLFVGYLSVSTFGHLFFLFLFSLFAAPLIFLALPLGQDQPNEVWLLAKLNFLFKSKTRLWIQGGQPEIIIQKKTPSEKIVTDPRKELDAQQANQEIQNITEVLDSRGQSILNHQSNLATSETITVDQEHERQQLSLNQHFYSLLNHHHQNHKSRIKTSVKQQQLSQTDQPTLDPQAQSSQKSSPVFGMIPKLAEAKDLKIAVLESIINKIQK
ncbi:MAG: PrgI family protein [Candidatus Saccharibacteria bacterium]|nr:PrgI family protein [Candidatus Saccharibacteria bacterium]